MVIFRARWMLASEVNEKARNGDPRMLCVWFIYRELSAYWYVHEHKLINCLILHNIRGESHKMSRVNHLMYAVYIWYVYACHIHDLITLLTSWLFVPVEYYVTVEQLWASATQQWILLYTRCTCMYVRDRHYYMFSPSHQRSPCTSSMG